MERRTVFCLVFSVQLLLSQAHPSSRALGNVTSEESAEDRYYSLLGALHAAISQHRGTTKTTNAGIALSDRVDLAHSSEPARHCADVYRAGYLKSGVYTIHPVGVDQLEVYCDMEERGGGWTVFQKRVDGKVDFYRNWVEYRRGFGVVAGEYWLGLENLYLLTHATPMELLVQVEDFDGNWRFAHYSIFAVASEFSDYRLDVGSYSGTAGDALLAHRGQRFSTKDRDNDIHSTHCATAHKGAWWYAGCYDSSLNGQYLQGQRKDHLGIEWRKWKDKYSLKTSIMMMRPIHKK